MNLRVPMTSFNRNIHSSIQNPFKKEGKKIKANTVIKHELLLFISIVEIYFSFVINYFQQSHGIGIT